MCMFINDVFVGTVGAVTKPVIGMGDGLSSVMDGISNEMTNNKNDGAQRSIRQIRPCRTFTRSNVSGLC